MMNECFNDVYDDLNNDKPRSSTTNDATIDIPFHIINENALDEPKLLVNNDINIYENYTGSIMSKIKKGHDDDECMNELTIATDDDVRIQCINEAMNMYKGVSEMDFYAGMNLSNPSKVMNIEFDIDKMNDNNIEITETFNPHAESNAMNSSSILRAPSTSNNKRGDYSHKPFRPGGLADDDVSPSSEIRLLSNDELFPWLNNDSKIIINDANELITSISSIEDALNGINIHKEEQSSHKHHQEYHHQQPKKMNDEVHDDMLRYEDIFDQLDSLRFLNNDLDDGDGNNEVKTSNNDDDDNDDVTSLLSKTPAPPPPPAAAPSHRQRKQKHEWAIMVPIDTSNFHQEIPNPPIWYPFELDDFQKQAILHLERGEDGVFVSAHTSAGKTVVAEYAIALCLKHLTRAIYTSPIKTLSNQKYREFRNTFGEDENQVGIMTGDVSINPNASCLILTTEILRSMLYGAADIIRDVEYVIFDEVHYINDIERGLVWEEVIIMLPAHIRIIMLSATVPNTFDFADWVGRTKKQKIHVISTEKRPVPLQHYLWHNGKMFNILDKNGEFHVDAFKQARNSSLQQLKPQKSSNNTKGRFNRQQQQQQKQQIQKRLRSYGHGSNSNRNDKNEWLKLIKFLQKQDLLPLAVFSFSKKQCDSCSYGIHSLDLNTNQEKSEIHLFLSNALSRLSKHDLILPQVQRIKSLVLNGIGVHHAGMLPILKEIVEMLFGKGLVKVLFATETFAMGVNMPTRTVVFNGVRKHDGQDFRWLLPGEYTQMSGRAGRRGLDQFGVVAIICRNGEVPDSWVIKNILCGQSTRLQSQFRLTYSMILNILRQEDMKIETMIKRSFLEVSTTRENPKRQQQLNDDEKMLNKYEIDCIHSEPRLIEEYYSLYKFNADINERVNQEYIKHGKWMGLMQKGRVIVITKYNLVYERGVVLNMIDQKIVRAIVLCPATWKLPKDANIELHSHIHSNTFVIIHVHPHDIHGISTTKLPLNNDDDDDGNLHHIIDQLVKVSTNGVHTYLNAFKEINLPVDLASDWLKKIENDVRIQASICHQCPRLNDHYEIMKHIYTIKQRIKTTTYISSDDSVLDRSQYYSKLRVLQQLQYVDHEQTVLLKGRVACEVNTCDPLIVTELIFENIFTNLNAGEIAALLSCLIFQQKRVDEPSLSSLTIELQNAKEALYEITERLGVLQLEYGVDIEVNDYVKDNINIGMIEVVHEWSKGTPFNEICTLTNVLEGSIVRMMKRLDETCRDVRNSARIIGDATLYQKMELASQQVKRDIVFAASLYVA